MKRFKGGKEEIISITQDVGSVLCEGLTFKDGNLSGIGKITINCYFVGNISTNDLVVVDEAGNVLGNIESQSIIIKGNVKGNVEAVESAQIRTGGVLNGDIKCASLEISAGAAFSGNCNMTASKKENNMLLNMRSDEENADKPPLPVYSHDKKRERVIT